MSPDKKFQIFFESGAGETHVGQILRREGLYCPGSARIREKAKEDPLERLADPAGAKCESVPRENYTSLKREEEERALSELVVELAILQKKNGSS